MIFRNLTLGGDWTFGQGYGNYLTGIPAIGLNIRTRIYSWIGDCFFALNAGIDWLNRLGSTNQKSLLDLELRRIILQSFGVAGIVTFDSELNTATRAYTAHFTVNTIYSQSYTDSITQQF